MELHGTFPWNSMENVDAGISMEIGVLMFSMEFHGKCPNLLFIKEITAHCGFVKEKHSALKIFFEIHPALRCEVALLFFHCQDLGLFLS